MWVSQGGTDISIDSDTKRELLAEALRKRGGRCSKILVLPPDVTRLHSGAGELTQILYEMLGKDSVFHIMPAIGTHEPLSEQQMELMYAGIPKELFKVHDWRNDIVELGVVPSEFISRVSEGKLDFEMPIQVNRILIEGGYDLIISIGQVVPHENTGMANYTKNVLVGIGGQETINKSHFLAGVYGMERIMGRIDTPMREVLDYAQKTYLSDIEIVYVLTVMGKDETGKLVTRGLYIGCLLYTSPSPRD